MPHPWIPSGGGGGSVTGVTGTAPIASSGGTTPDISIDPTVLSVVKVSIDDTTAHRLDSKIVAGSNIALAVLNDGGDEQLEISSTFNAVGNVFLGAPGTWRSITNGSFETIQVEYPFDNLNAYLADYASGARSNCEWGLAMPIDWDGGPITAQFYWLANSASTNSAVFGLQAVAFTDGNPINAGYGTAQEVTDANHGTNLINISPVTASITVGGSPAGGQWVQFRGYRLGTGADNLAAVARLLGIRITYTRL